jgi:hypothetical protein
MLAAAQFWGWSIFRSRTGRYTVRVELLISPQVL